MGAGWAQRNEHHPVIVAILTALDHAAPRQSIHQLDDRVLLDLEPFSENADRGGARLFQTLDLQKQLVLLRRYAGIAGGHLSNAEKLSNLIAQVGQGPVIEGDASSRGRIARASWGHVANISRRDISTPRRRRALRTERPEPASRRARRALRTYKPRSRSPVPMRGRGLRTAIR